MQHFGKLKFKVIPKRIYMEEEFGFENTQSKTHICTYIYIYIYNPYNLGASTFVISLHQLGRLYSS